MEHEMFQEIGTAIALFVVGPYVIVGALGAVALTGGLILEGVKYVFRTQ